MAFFILKYMVDMKFKAFILLSLIIILLISCGRKEYTEQGILEIKQKIDSLLHNPEGEEHFNWGSAKAYSNFRAYFQDSKLIFINEDYRYREPGESFNRYYFKDGNLLYYIGKALTYMPDKQFKNIEMMVDPDGQVIAYEKMVNGQRESLSGDEADLIVEHAQQLEEIVSKRSTISKK